MPLNPIAYIEKVAKSFLRYQLTAYPFSDPHLFAQMRGLLSLDHTRAGAPVGQMVNEGLIHPHLAERSAKAGQVNETRMCWMSLRSFLVILSMPLIGCIDEVMHPVQPVDVLEPRFAAKADSTLTDRQILTRLYEATDGPNWSNDDNWLTDAPLGNWYGVTTSTGDRVVRLELWANDLTGPIPPELSNLANLERLSLSGNDLTGPIPPELGKLANLEWLYLQYNALTGPIPPELGKLANLEQLYLQNNALTGPIPPELGDLAKLSDLRLRRNDLTGPIPPELGNLANLEWLYLQNNALTGPIPPELGKLAKLSVLWLRRNDLTGPIPPELGNLANLIDLFLSGNALTGPIPPELAKLANLEWLYLHDNALTGPIPPELGKLANLKHLHLGGTALTGPIPPELGKLANLEQLYLQNNALTGPIPPELGDLAKLSVLWLRRNDLTGPIPPELGNLANLIDLFLSGNALTGPVPATLLNLTVLEVLDLSDTGLCFPGTTAFWHWREQLDYGGGSYCNDADLVVLEGLYEATGGSEWNRADGWLGEGPALAGWHGITADSLGRVVALRLPANELDGRLPYRFELSTLRVLDVADNDGLQGPLPLSLTRVSLDTLRFRGTRLCSYPESQGWLESIPVMDGTGETCPPRAPSDRDFLRALYDATDGPNWSNSDNWLTDAPLEEWYGVKVGEGERVVGLGLRGNDLNGELPPELGNLTRLTSLDLSINDLTGEIPPELGKLTALESLELFYNDLTGSIPRELGNLVSLRILELNTNDLTGPIPPELGKLVALESMELYQNSLTGPIPPELGSLAALEELRLFDNALTGRIPPEFGQMTELRVLDFLNNGLNGPIPPELGKLTELEYLTLGQNNHLTGPIPPEFGNLTALKHLSVNRNLLTGGIPPELGNLSALEWLGLSGNDLTGGIPPELGNLTALEWLSLGSNDLSGPVPATLLKLTALRNLFLGDTDLCLPGTEEFLRWARATDYVSVDAYCSDSDRLVLEALYDATHGGTWNRSDGWLVEGPVLAAWEGVAADSLGRVVGLALSANNLAGRLAGSWGTLAELKALDISNNPLLQGPLPLSLTRISLDTLRFHGTGLCSHKESREWLESIPVAEGTGETCVPFSDRETLVALYEATGGANWQRSDNWLTDAPLGDWYGVTMNEEGQVVGLDLSRNALSGEIPPELGKLARLRSLRLGGNGLTGEIPPELGDLGSLTDLALYNNELSGEIPSELGKLAALTTLALGDNELAGEIPSELGNLAALTDLALYDNDLSGEIPSELGRLAALTELWLYSNDLSGRIPAELGDLSALTKLVLHTNDLSGVIPRELGNLAAVEVLSVAWNALTGPIPPGLGNLANLESLSLDGNALTGEIPSELGRLTALRDLSVSGNALTGEIPSELGMLASLRELWLFDNSLTGEIPPELGKLANLGRLYLNENGLSGALPTALTAVRGLHEFDASNTALCAPASPEFHQWAIGIQQYRVRQCPAEAAYLVQSVQSREFAVPLVARRQAMLRVFPTAPAGASVPVPPVRASFYRSGGAVAVYTVDIEGKPGPLPVEIYEGDLAASANVRIPGDVVRPGLEMVVEIDPEGTLDPALGVSRRLPAEGRTALDVHELPTMELTIVPFLWTEDPDSSVLATANGMVSDPVGHDVMRLPRALLPVHDWSVVAHEPVWTDIRPDFRNSGAILNLTAAIRTMEGGRGHWMGTLGHWMGTLRSAGGRAQRFGWISVSGLETRVVAHELGHNLSLAHAPCGNPSSVDRAFPYPVGRSGVWGYDFSNSKLVYPDRPDVMSYCPDGAWISDYHYANALRYRLRAETLPAAPARVLLLWGGIDSTGATYLEPAFVVDATPTLPEAGGPWALEGLDASGQILFELSFAMPPIADAGVNAGGFAYALPVGSGWEDLASITLSGPGGAATIDGSTDRPMSIWRDADGTVRAILQDDPVQADAAFSQWADRNDLIAVTSRGIPDWPRR